MNQSKMNKKLLFFFFTFLNFCLWAQQNTIPLNLEIQSRFEQSLLREDQPIFTLQRPFLSSDLEAIIDVDSLFYQSGRDSLMLSKFKHPTWWKKLRTEDLIYYRNSKNNLTIKMNPLFNFSGGASSLGNNLMNNTRGLEVKGSFGNKLSFGTGFYENQSFFPEYYNEYIKERKVVPGQGRSRIFKEDGYDYGHSFGYVSYSPTKNFNFQIGHSKLFIGDGYRSLILSDNAFNLPYAKWTTTYKNVRYTNLLVAYQNSIIADGTGEISNRRYGSFTSIDFLIGRFLEVGIVESIVWEKKDSSSFLPNLNLYNPILFFRTFQLGFNDKNNVLLGFNSKLKISKSIVSYFQFVFDDTRKWSYQIGIKSYQLFKTPLYIQAEYTAVKPYTYSHWDNQSYSHYNQEIGHPLGANFTEIVVRSAYHWKDVIFSYQINFVRIGLDSSNTNYGHDIFTKYIDSKGDEMLQGIESSILNQSIRLAFLVNPSTNFQLFMEYKSRVLKNEFQNSSEQFWVVGLSTNLQNRYSDF